MLEPVGPLPPSVYWRRRGMAIGAAVLTLILLTWGIGAAATGNDPAPVAAPAPATPTPNAASFVGPDPVAAALETPPGASVHGLPQGLLSAGGPGVGGDALGGTALGPTAPSVGGAPAAGATTPGAATSGPTTPGGTTPGAAKPEVPAPGSRSAAATSAGPAPAGRSAAAPTTPSPSPAPSALPSPPPAARAAAPAPPGPCADSSLRIAARTDKPSYRPGEKPVLSLVVTNIGATPCVRDLDAARQAVAVVRTPGDGLWGSNDCSPGSTNDKRTLRPGQGAVFAVRWSGRTSAPGCSGSRSPVPAGTYQLLARLDATISDPTTFTLIG